MTATFTRAKANRVPMLVGLAVYFGYGRRHSRVAALSHEEYRELSGAAPTDTTPASEPMKAHHS